MPIMVFRAIGQRPLPQGRDVRLCARTAAIGRGEIAPSIALTAPKVVPILCGLVTVAAVEVRAI